MTDEEAADIAARAEAATPGPWYEPDAESERGSFLALTEPRSPYYYDQQIIGDMSELNKNWTRDIHFITHAREDIPALLAERETLMQIVRAIAAADEPPFSDGAYQCCWCGLSYVMMPDDAEHADDCPITLARAFLARAKGSSDDDESEN